MSQYDFGDLSSPLSGPTFFNTHLEPFRTAVNSSHSGTSRPSYVIAGMCWINTTTNPWVVNYYDGTDDIPTWNLNTTTNVATPYILDTDGTLAANSDAKIASQKAVKTYADTKLPSSYLDTDVTLAANSDTKIASQKAIKAYVDQIIASADAMVFKGVIDCSANPNYPAADRGWTYRVSVAGKIGGASGVNVEVGDLLMCLTDSTASGNQATVGTSWTISQTNLDGAVIGPASATDSRIALWDGTTGKLLKNSSYDPSTFLTSVFEALALTPSANQNDYNTGAAVTNQAVISEVRIAPTNSIKLTGILATSAVNGKKLVIKNTTDPLGASARMILLERESASSTAANRFSYPSGPVPVIIMPGEQAEFRYNTTTSRWEFHSGTRCGGPSQTFDIWGDCLTSAPLVVLSSGTGAGSQISAFLGNSATQKTFGVAEQNCGTTTTGWCYIGSGGTAITGGQGAALNISRSCPTVLSTGSETYIAVMGGFADTQATGLTVDGAYWEYDQTTTTDYRIVTSNNSATTKTTVAGFTASITVMPYFGTFLNGDWTNADFFYSTDGDTWTFLTPVTTNIPTGTTRLTGIQTGLTKSAGTTGRAIAVDFIGVRLQNKRGV